MDVKRDKAELRREIAERIRRLGTEERKAQSASICETIHGLPEWATCQTLLAFLPLRDEPDLEELLSQGIADGKRVGLPRLGGAELRFGRIEDLSPASFRRNESLGFREPGEASQELHLSGRSPTLILAPGRAFDPEGRRMGRGGGYYDRFLATLSQLRPRGRAREGTFGSGAPTSQIVVVGVAFSAQLVDRVPTAPEDIPVDLVVTPDEVLDCRLFSLSS